MGKAELFIPKHMVTRSEALDLGLPLYGEVKEVYLAPGEDALEATITYMLGRMGGVVTERRDLPDGEILGTVINIVRVEPVTILMASLVERIHFRSDKAYKRGVEKAIARETATLHSWNKAVSTSS